MVFKTSFSEVVCIEVKERISKDEQNEEEYKI